MASGMKTIGLVGGMSWESSAVYYRDLNLGVQKRLGGLASPRLVMSTVDFAELTELEDAERWDQIGALLAEAGRSVERGGADFLLLCTTTFHKVADQVAAAVDIPLLHLADVVAEACAKAGVSRVAFIGTTVAMSDGFFTDRMASHELEVLVPPASEHDWLNSAIYEELVHGHVLDRTRRRVVELIHQLWDAGAEGVLLGCTELELLIHQADVDLPVFPCTTLHVEAALDRAFLPPRRIVRTFGPGTQSTAGHGLSPVSVQHQVGDPAQVGREVLLGDGRAVAAEVEVVDVHVRLGISAGHLTQVDPLDQLGELGPALRVGVEIDLAVGDQPGEAAGTPHPHPPLVGGGRWRLARAGRAGAGCHADGVPGLLDRSACSPAAATVAAAKAAKSARLDSPPVRAAYQIRPAPSADEPPIAVAASWKARLGMPELRWTPPWSSVVST